LKDKKTNDSFDLIVIGGGAAGFFCAIQCAERQPKLRICILEKSNKILSKVKVSGGGRCNVTHACFDPKEMVENYPRGKKELLGPFHKFLCGDMMAWLSDQGVETHIESDGRVFPESNKSQQIIDCFIKLCDQYKIEIRKQSGVDSIIRVGENWDVKTKTEVINAPAVMCTTGSSPAAWKMLGKLGHHIISPVPSLFTFNIKSSLIGDLPGISVPTAIVRIDNMRFEETGPLLITHWGLSGPAILKLSARAARQLFDTDYNFQILVNWVGINKQPIIDEIRALKKSNGKNLLSNNPLYQIPKRLWLSMLGHVQLLKKNYADLSKKDINNLGDVISECRFNVDGKSTFKDEFVTCGGVDTKEVNFKSMESKLHPGLFFAGEVLNIDAVTGGFNFQAAWTGAYIAAETIVKRLE